MSSTQPRISPLDVAEADAATAATLDAVKTKLGMVPNLFATLARSPVALNAYLQLSETTATGRLSPQQREIISLTVGQSNQCQYCLSAHTALGKGAGLSDREIAAARIGTASNASDAAIAGFARKVVEQRGIVTDADLNILHEASIDDGLVIEVVLNVVLNILTNYVNHIAGTEVDFPVVDLKAA